jgi:short-subunit dehydrogenase involved in D-alanine esterification of teichoic acids
MRSAGNTILIAGATSGIGCCRPVSVATSFCSPSARGPMAAPSKARVPQAIRDARAIPR